MRSKTTRFLLFSLFLSFILPVLPAFAWNSTGHRVSAAIAWEYLTPTARATIIEILKSAPANSDLLDLYDMENPKGEKYFFMNAAYWPDIIRDRDAQERYQTYHKGNWHYIGSYWKQTDDGIVEVDGQVDDENLVERIRYFRKSLADSRVSNAEKAVQIAWTLHLVGDIHMPLHNTSRVTKATPDGDLGGNAFSLGSSWPRNLHAFWDGIIDLASPKMKGMNDYDYYEAMAKEIIQHHPIEDYKTDISVQNATAWNQEGKEIVHASLYPPTLKEGEAPSKEYLAASFAIAEERIALSGYRMATFLNQIFDH